MQGFLVKHENNIVIENEYGDIFSCQDFIETMEKYKEDGKSHNGSYLDDEGFEWLDDEFF